MRVAIGLKARTGRAILVAVGGDLDRPRFVERSTDARAILGQLGHRFW